MGGFGRGLSGARWLRKGTVRDGIRETRCMASKRCGSSAESTARDGWCPPVLRGFAFRHALNTPPDERPARALLGPSSGSA
jgi:hypothetical protein